MLRYSQVALILEGFSYKPGYELKYSQTYEKKFVHAWWDFPRVNVLTGEEGIGHSGHVTFDLLSEELTEENVVRGIWGMTLRLEEHEAREFFSYFDQRPFEPHQKLVKDVVTAVRDIENTEKLPPAQHLLGAMVEGSSSYIENMEARGASQLVQSQNFPVACSVYNDVEQQDKRLLEMGFILGEPLPNDPIFRRVTLPSGWYRRTSDHDMWTYIVDETGKDRVAIFYKAAFYDRSSHYIIED